MNILHSHTKSTLILHPDCRFIAEIEAGTPDFWELQSLTLGEVGGDSRIMIYRADWEGFKAMVAEINQVWQVQNQEVVDSMSDFVDSTSDNRVVNNVMRHEYRVLTDSEKSTMQAIKDKGLELHDLIESIGQSRELSLAKTKTEEAVMWAVKHLTK